MSAIEKNAGGGGRARTSDTRDAGSAGQKVEARPDGSKRSGDVPPAAGAHAADHLVNEDSTPGAGALPSRGQKPGREVDGGAG